MSKIGKININIPDKVKVILSGQTINVEGPLGKQAINIDTDLFDLVIDEGKKVSIKPKILNQDTKRLWGMSRSLLNNAITGTSKGYEKILKEDNSYDVVMCVGTFTFAHVKAHAIDEFVRITKPKGLICFTINEAIYINHGFKSKIDNLVNDNKIKEIEFFKSSYLASKDVNAWLGLYKVL